MELVKKSPETVRDGEIESILIHLKPRNNNKINNNGVNIVLTLTIAFIDLLKIKKLEMQIIKLPNIFGTLSSWEKKLENPATIT